MKEWCFEHPILTFILICIILLELDCYIEYLNNRLKVKLTTLEQKKEENKTKYNTYNNEWNINK